MEACGSYRESRGSSIQSEEAGDGFGWKRFASSRARAICSGDILSANESRSLVAAGDSLEAATSSHFLAIGRASPEEERCQRRDCLSPHAHLLAGSEAKVKKREFLQAGVRGTKRDHERGV